MSHGGMITRVEKKWWKIVNAYFVHSTSVDMKWPVEVPLFGPWGYYEKVKSDIRKNTIFIWRPKKDFYKNTPTIA